ncbi:uncharacterized protein LOC118434832 [Folsomia candida]|uniref:uncharacterized protein LOC118434832 n=1 Tax=Folsomia candida TaxID=158441 RepID=UPI001604A453|nr:uncharacterized protein LOC118434832 [Folsomia candida]XP_035705087.1 uncharacterized protein LOC118434832 [Folsomia candida]
MSAQRDRTDEDDLDLSFEIDGRRYSTIDEYLTQCQAQGGPLSSVTTGSSTLPDKENQSDVDDCVKLGQETIVSSSASVRGPFRVVSASATSSCPSTTFLVPTYDKTEDKLEKKTPPAQRASTSTLKKVQARDEGTPSRAGRDRYKKVSAEVPPPTKKSRPLVYTDSDDDDDADLVTSPVKKREDSPLNDETEKVEWEEWILKKHNQIVGFFEDHVRIEEGAVTKLILEDDPISGRVVEVNPDIMAELLPHHFRGVKFMYETCFGGFEQEARYNSDMFTLDYLVGPGRETQVAAFAQAVLKNEPRPGLGTILILCPLLKRQIWSCEIDNVFETVDPDQRPLLHDVWQGENIRQKINSLKLWTSQGGVAILDFDLFQKLDEYYVDDDDDDSREVINNSLFTPGPAIVFLDFESIDKRYVKKKYKGLLKITTTRQVVFPDLYSQDPVQHINRVIFRDWLSVATTGFFKDHYNKFLFLCDLVDYHVKKEVHWIQKKGFATTQIKGSNSFLKSDFPCQWRKGISNNARNYDRNPERREKLYVKNNERRRNIPNKYVLYILVISPKVGPLRVQDLCDPEFDLCIYIGQWDAATNDGDITCRQKHFCELNSPVYILTSDPKNQCNEVLAQQCLNQFVAHFGEAFLLYYADEWNQKIPDKPKFILSSPEVKHLDEDGSLEEKARNMARDGIWIFSGLGEDEKPHPPQHARFDHLCKLPFGIKTSYIKSRVIPGLGQGSNCWKNKANKNVIKVPSKKTSHSTHPTADLNNKMYEIVANNNEKYENGLRILGTYVLYILVISPKVGPLRVQDLCDPEFDLSIYIGQWDAANTNGDTEITCRRSHFCELNSPVYILTSDPKNQCNEVLAQQCLNQFVAHFGEAFLLYYADEWNQLHPDKPKFILSSPKVKNLDEDGTLEQKARNMARDGIWIFVELGEDEKPHPPKHARFNDLSKIPFAIKTSYIKSRVIPGLGQGSNCWKN